MELLLDTLRRFGWPIPHDDAEELVVALPTTAFRLPPSPARDVLRVGRLAPSAEFPWCVLLVDCGERRLERWTLRSLAYPFVHEKTRTFGWFQNFPLERILILVIDEAGTWAVHQQGERAMGSRMGVIPVNNAPLQWTEREDWDERWRAILHERRERTQDRRRFSDAFYRARSEGLADLVLRAKAHPALTLNQSRVAFARLVQGSEGVRERIFWAVAEPAIAYTTRYWLRHPEIRAPLEDVIMPVLSIIWEKLGEADATKASDPRYLFPWISRTVMRTIRDERRPLSVPAYVEERYREERAAFIAGAEAELSRTGRGTSSRLIWSMEFDEPWPSIEEDTLVAFDPRPTLESRLSAEELFAEGSARDGLLFEARVKPQHAFILLLRCGLHPLANGAPLTLEQTATATGLTRERVRQIESAALSRLRAVLIAREESPVSDVVSTSTMSKESVATESPEPSKTPELFARIVKEVHAGNPRTLKVREVLALFGFKNRGVLILGQIRRVMESQGVRCIPRIDNAELTLESVVQIVSKQ